MATAHKLTNKNFSEWQVDQALAFAKESIDSRFCPGYAMKNPTLVGILMQMQMNLEMKLDDLDAQDFQKKVTEPVTETDTTKVEFTYKILSKSFAVNQKFTAQEAYDAIRPYRFSNKFKSEKSYRGTILAELQALRDDGRIFYYPNQRGNYCRLR